MKKGLDLTSIECLKKLFAIKGVRKRGIIALGALGVVTSATSLVLTLVFMKIVDGVIAGSRAEFLHYALIYLVTMLLVDLICSLIAYLREKTSLELELRIREHFFECIQSVSEAERSKIPKGELMHHLGDDVNTVVYSIMSVLTGIPSLFVTLIGAAVIIIIWDTRFAVVLLAGCVLMVLGAVLFKKVLKKRNKEVQEAYDREMTFVDEALDSSVVIKAFGMRRTVEREFDRIHVLLRKARMRRHLVANVRGIGYDLAFDGAYFAGLFWWGLRVIDGSMTCGKLLAILKLINLVQSPFAGITGYVSDLYRLQASAERLFRFEELPWDIDAVEGASRGKAADGSPDFQIPEIDAEQEYAKLSAICAKGVRFSYRDEPVLNGAGLTVFKGECAALVGESGAGKSTLLRLLMALMPPDGGELYLQNEDGTRVSVSPFTRPMFAYVPQEEYFFSGSILRAVSFMDEDRPEEEVRARVRYACEIACADEFIEKLAEGYDSEIRQRGAGLSEGQIQRLSIARALYSGAPVLIFDEATSALDEGTEKRLLENIQKLTDRTVLIVTHRPAALSICSRVITVTDGKFEEIRV